MSRVVQTATQPSTRTHRVRSERIKSRCGVRTRANSRPEDETASTSRRQIINSFASLSLVVPLEATATTKIEYDGRLVDAYAFDVPLKVRALRGSTAQNASREFAQTQTRRVKLELSTTPSIARSYEELLQPGKRIGKKGIDCATLGDEWLRPAIERGLILPIPNAARSAWWNAMPPVWKQLVRRDPRSGLLSSSGEIFGAPYRFGCVTIAYRKDKLPKGVKPPTDWSDLFDPRLQGIIGMPNAPRLVLSAALKAEGMSVNVGDVGGVDGRVSARVRQLRESVKVFDDLQYLQAIACGDCAVVVGPSEDVFSVARRSTLIVPVVPRSGTTLWSDCWVVPTTSVTNVGGGPSPALEQWINYTLSPARLNMRVGLKGGISPLMFDGRGIESGYARYPNVARPVLGTSDEDMLKGWIPDDSVWAASEFQLPLTDRVRAQYVAMSRR